MKIKKLEVLRQDVKMKNEGHEARVRKSNVFVDGRYRFNLHEQKILLQIISKIRMDDKEFSPYFVSWEDLKKISNGYLDTAKKIDESCQKLKNKTIKIKKGESEDNFGFLSGWKTTPGLGVHFRIDQSMKEMLLDLLAGGKFTLYNLECAMALNSSHSIRLYEILKSNQWKKQPFTLTLKDLKWSIDIGESSPTYDDFSNFRVHILEKAQKAFKRHTDIVFDYVPIKEGRRVVALEITVKENRKYQTTVQGEITKEETKSLLPGSIIMMDGKEYEYTGSGMYTDKGVIPGGEVYKLLKQGKAKLK
jgi:plasmid replication initiation protein